MYSESEPPYADTDVVIQVINVMPHVGWIKEYVPWFQGGFISVYMFAERVIGFIG